MTPALGTVGACLVIIRGMAIAPDGWSVRIDDPDAVIEVKDPDTKIALKAQRDVRAPSSDNGAGHRLIFGVTQCPVPRTTTIRNLKPKTLLQQSRQGTDW